VPDHVYELLPPVGSAVLLLLSASAGFHAVLHKRDVRSAAGWVGVILLVPGIGALLYALLGINRIRRRAVRLRLGLPRPRTRGDADLDARDLRLGPAHEHLTTIARVIDRITLRPLTAGNRIEPLRSGDEAYPAMLAAIEGAQRSIVLATYIFSHDDAGKRFARALGEARDRGVEVRVLVDDAGARYSMPPIDLMLIRRGVRTARFLRVWLPWAMPYFNLRNHRKVLVVDGRVGFTGGMNIREDCLLLENPRHPTEDLHFRVQGPVVAQLMDAFGEDWAFATREVLQGDRFYPELAPAGDAVARAILDGPDEDLDKMRWAFLAGLSSARRSIRIVTPYFLPDDGLVTAIDAAALRGIEVDIVLPARGNLRLVEWAMHGEIGKVLHHGARVWLTPPPFDHTKLLVVDAAWTLLGSANWDPRSLRLNFELGVESYDLGLAARMEALAAEKIARARRLDPGEPAAWSLPRRMRNGVARLFTPYL
jgi:cardiolipin synthase